MPNRDVKVFPLRLKEDMHTRIKESAEMQNKSIHQFILDAADEAVNASQQNKEAFELIKRAYQFIQGGPSQQLEQDLFNWLLENK